MSAPALIVVPLTTFTHSEGDVMADDLDNDGLQALHDTQSEHTATLREHTAILNEHTALLSDHSTRLNELGAQMQAGFQLITEKLDTLIERDG